MRPVASAMERLRLAREFLSDFHHDNSNISSDDMKEMFEMALRRTYELLLQQLQQARRSGTTVIKVC